jgi:hypothetical protein
MSDLSLRVIDARAALASLLEEIEALAEHVGLHTTADAGVMTDLADRGICEWLATLETINHGQVGVAAAMDRQIEFEKAATAQKTVLEDLCTSISNKEGELRNVTDSIADASFGNDLLKRRIAEEHHKCRTDGMCEGADMSLLRMETAAFDKEIFRLRALFAPERIGKLQSVVDGLRGKVHHMKETFNRCTNRPNQASVMPITCASELRQLREIDDFLDVRFAAVSTRERALMMTIQDRTRALQGYGVRVPGQCRFKL